MGAKRSHPNCTYSRGGVASDTYRSIRMDTCFPRCYARNVLALMKSKSSIAVHHPQCEPSIQPTILLSTQKGGVSPVLLAANQQSARKGVAFTVCLSFSLQCLKSGRHDTLSEEREERLARQRRDDSGRKRKKQNADDATKKQDKFPRFINKISHAK